MQIVFFCFFFFVGREGAGIAFAKPKIQNIVSRNQRMRESERERRRMCVCVPRSRIEREKKRKNQKQRKNTK